MKKSSDDVVLTLGHFFDFFIAEKQLDSLKELTSLPAMKACTKGFLHLIPSSAMEKGKMPSMPVVLVEMDNQDYVEYGISRDTPQNTLNKEAFLQKYFPTEFAFSWVNLPKEEQPALPIFIVGAKVEDIAYRICEFKGKDEASQFVELTARGLKNLAAHLLERIPQTLPLLAQFSEFQIVHGVRVLVYRIPPRGFLGPQKTLSRDKKPFAYVIWWSHENLVFYVAPPAQVIPQEDGEHFLSGSIEKDKEYKKGLASLDIYIKYSNRLLKEPAPIERAIQGFDSWNWNLKETTPVQALERRVISILPTVVGGNEASSFLMAQINVQRKGLIGALRSSTPPKSVYAKSWNTPRDWLNQLTPANSRLAEAKDRLQILIDAFNNGPPVANVSVHYGPNIAVSVLFFPKDFEGPINSTELARIDEWKMFFVNTLRNKYCVVQKVPFMLLDTGLLDTRLGKIVGLIRMNVAEDRSKNEYIWIWEDECGIFFLSVVGEDDHSIGEEFLRLLTMEKQKAIPAAFEGGKETIRALISKMDYFFARHPKNSDLEETVGV